jgi:hypothetical protein
MYIVNIVYSSIVSAGATHMYTDATRMKSNSHQTKRRLSSPPSPPSPSSSSSSLSFSSFFFFEGKSRREVFRGYAP